MAVRTGSGGPLGASYGRREGVSEAGASALVHPVTSRDGDGRALSGPGAGRRSKPSTTERSREPLHTVVVARHVARADRILLRGATSYIGGCLLHRLQTAGRPVRCAARPPDQCIAARTRV